jgi:hypothetical protein
VEGIYKFSKEQLGSTKCGEFLDQLMTYWLLKDYAPWSCGAVVITAIIVTVIIVIIIIIIIMLTTTNTNNNKI